MKKCRFFLILIFLLMYPFIHETSHWVTAYLFGFEIIRCSYCSISINIFSVPALTYMIFFKSSGFIITFYPALCVFLYLWRKKSPWAHLPYLWLMISPIVSGQDFLDIGKLVVNITLTKGIYMLSQYATFLMMIIYFYDFYLKKGILFSFLDMND